LNTKLNDVQVSFSEFEYHISSSLNTYSQFSHTINHFISHLFQPETDCHQDEYQEKSSISFQVACGSSVSENIILSFHSYHHKIILPLYIVHNVGCQTAEYGNVFAVQSGSINTGLNPLYQVRSSQLFETFILYLSYGVI
jgi:hypothetical protein